jgi:hypothetical protein
MSTFAQARELNANEKALIDFLLTADFPGRDELRDQLGQVQVLGDCDCGCGTVSLSVPGAAVRADAREPIPVEAYNEDGSLSVLLFVREGMLASLEIVDYVGGRGYPTPAKLSLWVPPPPRQKP